MRIVLSLYITLTHFFLKEKLPRGLFILLDYVKITTLLETHFKILLLLLFCFISILTPKLTKLYNLVQTI